MNSYEQGAMFHRQGRIDKAIDCYIKALDEGGYDDAQLLYLIGTIMMQRKQNGFAIPFFRQSIMLNRGHFGAWNNLGTCYKAVNKEADATECWNNALTLKSHDYDKADVYNNLGTIHINSGTPELGFPIFEKSLSLNSEHADAHWNKALCSLEMGDFSGGFDDYHWGFKTGTRMMRNYGDNVPMWDGSKGKHVIVWGEQGIGDEIMFSSMIPDLIKDSASVIFDCHPRLIKIFKNSFPRISLYGTRKDMSIDWIDRHKEANAKISIGDLGKFYRRNVKDFPGEKYLSVHGDRDEHFKKKLAKLGDKPKIGISWTGGYVKTRKDHRSIGLELWEPILKQDATFVSLQYTPEATTTIGHVEDKLGIDIHHWAHVINADDYHETAALVNNLDLIITVNTSIHHLAGALGKKCWTMTPFAKAWRYYSPDDESKVVPWYKSVKQYQQKELYQWEPVINRVARDLKNFLA